MTQEEKAKRYDYALTKARNIVNSINVGLIGKDSFEAVFPELKESEDESIREEIISHLKYLGKYCNESMPNVDKWIAWLEKQGDANKEYWRGYREGKQEILDKYAELEKQGEQKNAWSEEDERMYKELYHLIYSAPYGDSRKKLSDWFKSIKDVVQTQPKQEWKQENIGDLDGFEIVMMQIGSSFFGKNAGLDPNDTNAIKEQANILLGLVQKQEWSKEDEKIIKRIDSLLYSQCKIHGSEYEEIHNWLKSLRPQSHWKPSDEQIKAIKWVMDGDNPENWSITLKNLYQDLKKLREE